MTSNLGSQYIQQKWDEIRRKDDSQRPALLEEANREVMGQLKEHFRPEFLNRIDIIIFQPLTQPQIEQVVKLQIAGINHHLEANGIELKVSDEVIAYLAKAGYDPEFGARPVKRAIQNHLLNDLSKTILSGSVDKTKPIVADMKDGQVVFSN